MNIFYLDPDPKICASLHCDKHVVKMILETAQLLSTAHHMSNSKLAQFMYAKTHVNHPSSIWARSSKANYNWLVLLFKNLCKEYTNRYNKTHKTYREYNNFLEIVPDDLPDKSFTQPPQAMPNKYYHTDSVVAYRQYYMYDKFNKPWFKFKYGLPEIWKMHVKTKNCLTKFQSCDNII